MKDLKTVLPKIVKLPKGNLYFMLVYVFGDLLCWAQDLLVA